MEVFKLANDKLNIVWSFLLLRLVILVIVRVSLTSENIIYMYMCCGEKIVHTLTPRSVKKSVSLSLLG